MGDKPFLDSYSGQSVDELIAMESDYRIDSLVLAFEEAISSKKKANDVERVILAVEALEREVNNGGYEQFFTNSSNEFAPVIVDALNRIGCPKTAGITRRAFDGLGLSGEISVDAIESVMDDGDDEVSEMLGECDDLYYAAPEPIAERLFEFIKKHRFAIRLSD